MLGCTAHAVVRGRMRVGGLAGRCDAFSPVSSNYSDGEVYGETRVGGLVGEFDLGTLQDSYSHADVYGTSEVGGLFGAGYAEDTFRTYSVGGVATEGTRSQTSERAMRLTKACR